MPGNPLVRFDEGRVGRTPRTISESVYGKRTSGMISRKVTKAQRCLLEYRPAMVYKNEGSPRSPVEKFRWNFVSYG